MFLNNIVTDRLATRIAPHSLLDMLSRNHHHHQFVIVVYAKCARHESISLFAFIILVCFAYLLGNFQCILCLMSSPLTNKDDDDDGGGGFGTTYPVGYVAQFGLLNGL